MYSPHKNSYLQTRAAGINPRIINRAVQKARDEYVSMEDLTPPLNRVTSEQPSIPIENVDPTRRPEAFGRWAIPKLKRELHNPDPHVVLCAITSLYHLVHDPEKGYEAISLKIIDRMEDLVVYADYPAIRERCFIFLKVIAGLADGKESIVKNTNLLKNMLLGLEDPAVEVRGKVAVCIEEIALFWRAADVLVDNGFIEILLLHLLEGEAKSEITASHLRTLKSLMYGTGKEIAMDWDGFNIFMRLLDDPDPEVISGACDCLMLVASTRLGKKLAYKANILEIVNRLLHHENIEVCRSAASVAMFCTMKTKDKIAAAQIPGLAKRLVQLTKCQPTQIYAIKALTNICEHPEIRKEVLENYQEDISTILTGDDDCLKTYKQILLNIVGWVPTDKIV